MKLKMIVVDMELTKTQRRVGQGVLAALLIATSGIAFGGVPNTFAAGQTLKAADMNANFSALDGRITALEGPRSYVAAHGFSSLVVPANYAFVTLPFGTVATDTLSEYNPSTGVFTAKQAGAYLVCTSLSTSDGAVTGTTTFPPYGVDLFVNGTREETLFSSFNDTNNNVVGTGCGMATLAANDTLELKIASKNGGTYHSVAGVWDHIRIARVN